MSATSSYCHFSRTMWHVHINWHDFCKFVNSTVMPQISCSVTSHTRLRRPLKGTYVYVYETNLSRLLLWDLQEAAVIAKAVIRVKQMDNEMCGIWTKLNATKERKLMHDQCPAAEFWSMGSHQIHALSSNTWAKVAFWAISWSVDVTVYFST